jgi:hypothetical protein
VTTDVIAVLTFILVVYLAVQFACIEGDAAWVAEPERRND